MCVASVKRQFWLVWDAQMIVRQRYTELNMFVKMIKHIVLALNQNSESAQPAEVSVGKGKCSLLEAQYKSSSSENC